MDCSICEARKACTEEGYTGRCPEPPDSVCFRYGEWWAEHGEAGPFKSKAEAEAWEEEH